MNRTVKKIRLRKSGGTLATFAVLLALTSFSESFADNAWEVVAPIIDLEPTDPLLIDDSATSESDETADVQRGSQVTRRTPISTPRISTPTINAWGSVHRLSAHHSKKIVGELRTDISSNGLARSERRGANRISTTSNMFDLTRMHYQAARAARYQPQPSHRSEASSSSDKARRVEQATITNRRAPTGLDSQSILADRRIKREDATNGMAPVHIDLSSDLESDAKSESSRHARPEIPASTSRSQPDEVANLPTDAGTERSITSGITISKDVIKPTPAKVQWRPASFSELQRDVARPSWVPTSLQGQPSRPEAITSPPPAAAPRVTSPQEIPVADEAFKPMRELQASIAHTGGELPINRAQERFSQENSEPHVMGFSRHAIATEVNWEAPGLCHQPLYFEQVNLERHGHQVRFLQPVLSGAHFFSRVPAVPYLLVSQKQRDCHYTLGHYRPGSCAPHVWYYPNFSLDGAALEATLITGLAYAIP